jgi:hypothetical protein
VSNKTRIKLVLKTVGVVAMCCSLSGCSVFCACAYALVYSSVPPKFSDAAWFWSAILDDCSNPVVSTEICPASGLFTIEDAHGHFSDVPCTPDTIDPITSPSWASEALAPFPDTPSSDDSQVVQSAQTSLPQSPRRSRRLGPPLSIDCTDPANAGRGPCAGTYRQNKPLLPPGD